MDPLPVPLNPYNLKSETEFWGTGDGFKPAKREIRRKVFHSTDEAIKKQFHNTREIQKQLSEELDKLESGIISDGRSLAIGINNLYRKAEHLVLVLDMLGRLNKELKFCRRKAAKSTDNKTRTVLSRRIDWLEKCVFTSVESNDPEKLDDVLGIQRVPEVKRRKRLAKKTLREQRYPGSMYSYSSVGSEKSLYPTSPPKSILHLTPDYSFPPYATKTPSPLKKAVTLVPPSIFEHTEVEDQKPEDAAEAYWQTDHHRYIYTPNKDVILEETPHSYHNLGLAVPANYVPPPPEDHVQSAGLPWLRKQDAAKGDFDILREDLERILRRTRRIQEKVWKAADMSVEFEEREEGADENERFLMMSRLKSQGSTRDRMRQSTRGSTVASVRSGITQVTSSLRSSREGSASTFTSSGSYLTEGVPGDTHGFMQDNIPLTRTNMSKQYPHTYDRWTEARPDPENTMTQPSIVNQRNLCNQTKIRLYVPKRGKPRFFGIKLSN